MSDREPQVHRELATQPLQVGQPLEWAYNNDLMGSEGHMSREQEGGNRELAIQLLQVGQPLEWAG